MWPSQESASRVYDFANLGLIIGLAIGIVATILIVWMGNIKEGYLRRDVAKSNSEAAKANERAGNLELESATQKERAAVAEKALEEVKNNTAKANKQAAEAEDRAAQANKTAEGFRLDIAKANERAAEANKTAEQERVERLKLEAQIAPRRLNLSQQQAIAVASSRFARRTVRVQSYSLDSEAAVLAKQIIGALQAGGMNVEDGIASIMPLGSFALGVHVSGTESDLVIGLSAILSSVGSLVVAPPNAPQVGGATIGTSPSGAVAVTVLVGVKPIQ